MELDFMAFSEPGKEGDNKPVSEGEPWWRDIGCHWHIADEDLELVREAEQVAVVYDKRGRVIHFCVQYQEWKSCKVMPLKTYVHRVITPEDDMRLAQEEINFLKLMYGR